MSDTWESTYKNLFGTVRLWHPRGVAVELPVSLGAETAPDYFRALASVSEMLDAGWLAAGPDEAGGAIGAGEERGAVGFVVRSAHAGKRGVTPLVDLYGPRANHVKPFLRVYLDTPTDVAAFERASGLVLDRLPLYEGEGRVELGKPLTAKYVVAPAKPCEAVYTLNPAFDPNETDVAKKKPKRLFARWAEQAPGVAAPPHDPDADEERKEFDRACATARTRYTEARTLEALAEAWNDTPAAVQKATEGDKNARKVELQKKPAPQHPPARPGDPHERDDLLNRARDAGRVLRLAERDLIGRFAVPLKLDPQKIPTGVAYLQPEQLTTLVQLAEKAVTGGKF